MSQDYEPLLTPAEVARMFRVDPKTVTRWANAGRLPSIRTLGGHRRFREAEVRALLAGLPATATVPEADAPDLVEYVATHKQCAACGTPKPEAEFPRGSFRCTACTIALSGATPEAATR